MKEHRIKKICILGAESTGTTTLTKDLAKHFCTCWVPEFGRFYSEGKLYSKKTQWDTKEFEFIAQEQNRAEEYLAKKCNKILFCDTNSFATEIWHERYLGFRSERLAEIASHEDYDLIIVTGDEILFVQDGTRDGEHIRHWMHNRFIDELQKSNKPYIIVSGSHEKRMELAISRTSQLL